VDVRGAEGFEVRTLRRAERSALLDLLDLWEMPDGWRGRDFFRRYVEDDPSFADENVWLALRGGRPVSCVQVFPRPVRIRGQVVPMGGIGSVFTRPEERRAGAAEALLAAAAGAMRRRGMLVSLLFATRIPWYTRLGWRSWEGRRSLLERDPAAGAASPPPGADVAPFDAARDLAAVARLHERYSARLEGSVVRDDALWRAALANAGNPREEFLVARRAGELIAYARATALQGFLVLSEWGRAEGAEDALAGLVDGLLSPRPADPFATAARPSAELRRLGVTIHLALDPPLLERLAARGLRHREVADPTGLWRCLDATALGARVGVPPEPGEEANDFLARLLPPERFAFWTADRF
jgi:GNAT superfamily N-acetyltransferase